MREIVVFDRFTKRYRDVFAVKNLTMSVREGEVKGVLGPNGSGKTTSLLGILGVVKPTHGSVAVFGYDPAVNPKKVRNRIGFVPELPSLYPELTVAENIMFIARLYGVPQTTMHEEVRYVIEKMGLSSYEKIQYGKLSKGLKRRVDIAAALVHGPELLVMDEPTAGLDVLASETIRGVIMELSKTGVTIILSSHYIDEAVELSDSVAILYKGTKIFDKNPDELRKILGIGKRIRIYVDRPLDEDSVIRALLEIDYIQEESLVASGRRIEFYTSDPVYALRQALGVLEKEGYRVVDIDSTPPSWRDLFRKYIEESHFMDEEACSCPGVGGN